MVPDTGEITVKIGRGGQRKGHGGNTVVVAGQNKLTAGGGERGFGSNGGRGWSGGGGCGDAHKMGTGGRGGSNGGDGEPGNRGKGGYGNHVSGGRGSGAVLPSIPGLVLAPGRAGEPKASTSYSMDGGGGGGVTVNKQPEWRGKGERISYYLEGYGAGARGGYWGAANDGIVVIFG